MIFTSNEEEITYFKQHLLEFKNEATIRGVSFAKPQHAKYVFLELNAPDATLLTAESTSFKGDIVITTTH